MGRKIKGREAKLKEYIAETIWCMMDQIADGTRSLRKLNEVHVTGLRESLLVKET